MVKAKAKRGAPPKPTTIAKVVTGKWTAKQLAAITFLANPRGGTQEELAGELKVDRHTITEWKKLDGFMEDVHRVAAVYFLEADLQVDRAVLRAATGYERTVPVRDKAGNFVLGSNGKPMAIKEEVPSDIKAAELWYKRRGLLVEKRQLTGADGGPISVSHEDGRITSLLSEYSDDDLNAIIATASRGADKKRRRRKASKKR